MLGWAVAAPDVSGHGSAAAIAAADIVVAVAVAALRRYKRSEEL